MILSTSVPAGASVNSPLAISVCWCVYNGIPHFLIVYYAYVSKGPSLAWVCRICMVLSFVTGALAVGLMWGLYPKQFDMKVGGGGVSLALEGSTAVPPVRDILLVLIDKQQGLLSGPHALLWSATRVLCTLNSHCRLEAGLLVGLLAFPLPTTAPHPIRQPTGTLSFIVCRKSPSMLCTTWTLSVWGLYQQIMRCPTAAVPWCLRRPSDRPTGTSAAGGWRAGPWGT